MLAAINLIYSVLLAAAIAIAWIRTGKKRTLNRVAIWAAVFFVLLLMLYWLIKALLIPALMIGGAIYGAYYLLKLASLNKFGGK